MKISITRDNLQKGLAAVAGSVPTRTTLPVLANLLLEAEDGGLTISGTDLDTGVSVRVPAEVNEPGAITAPAKKLQEITRELPPEQVEVTTRNEIVSIHCGRAKFRLNGLPREEFPEFPSADFSRAWTITAVNLQELVGRVAFAASTEETRPILNGVLWEISEGQMRMVATNGHRLAKMAVPTEDAGESGEMIVHPRALTLATRVFASEETLQVARLENHLVFRGDAAQIYTRLIEGPYPNYQQVIPQDNDKVMTVGRDTLSAVIRRMSVVASDQTHRVRLSLGGSTARFSVETPDLGEATEELPVDYDGDPLEIGFNARYLQEVFKHVPAEEVRMAFKAPERAATIVPVDSDSETEFLCLVMPLRLID